MQSRFMFNATKMLSQPASVNRSQQCRLSMVAHRPFSLINNDNSGNDIDSEAAAKASAKEFLNKVEEDLIIDEVNTQAEWTTKVMEVTDKPVILDFYADWCAPCKKLTPVLEQLTRDNEGKFKLVKINIDNLP